METVPGEGSPDVQPYEFTDAQNEVIGSTGFWVGVWGVFSLIAGGLNALAGVLLFVQGELGGVVAGIVLGVLALIPVFIGLKFLRTGTELGAVVWTEGSDIDHLMDAIHSVGAAFRVQMLAVVFWMVILIVFWAVFFETQVRGG